VTTRADDQEDDETTSPSNKARSRSSSENLQVEPYSPSSSESPPAIPSLYSDNMNTNEQRALLYFTERTAPILSTIALGSAQFWTRIIPSLSLSNSTVKSAMIAAASLHENVHYRGKSLQPGIIPESLYTKHLSKAITSLTTKDPPPSREVVLMSCLLFLACENLKQSSTTAHLHVQSGLKLLREYKSEQPQSRTYFADSFADIVENNLEPIFARLEAQLSLTKDPAESRGYFQTYDLNWDPPVIPERFDDLFTARDSMHDNVQYMFYQSRLSGIPFYMENPAYKQISRLFEQWDATFARSFPMCDDRNWPGWTAAGALRVHQLCLQLGLHGEANESMTFWDERLDDVKWLLDMCSDIITTGPPPTSERDSLWLYDFCLNPPLLLTAMNCRQPNLRRKAIHLMKVQHCWDNDDSFDACGTAKIAECIMKAEEDELASPPLLAEDIPVDRRVRPLMVWLAEKGKVKLFYDREGDKTVREKVVDWAQWRRPVQETLFMYPLGELVKYGQFQGLIRPNRLGCMCKSMGKDAVEGEWWVNA
jgi:hypothetical protein